MPDPVPPELAPIEEPLKVLRDVELHRLHTEERDDHAARRRREAFDKILWTPVPIFGGRTLYVEAQRIAVTVSSRFAVSDAGELLNDLLMVFHTRTPFIEDLRRLRPYLWRAALNLVKAATRRSRTEPGGVELREDLAASDPPAEDPVETAREEPESPRDISRLKPYLSKRMYEILDLLEQGYNNRGIGEKLQMSPTNVRVARMRLRVLLRDLNNKRILAQPSRPSRSIRSPRAPGARQQVGGPEEARTEAQAEMGDGNGIRPHKPPDDLGEKKVS